MTRRRETTTRPHPRRRWLRAVAVAIAIAAPGLGACGSSDDSNDTANGDSGATTDNGDGGGASSGVQAPGGGLTVSEALTTDATAPLLVRGYVVSDGDSVKLCEAIDTSQSPPTCEGQSAPLRGYDAAVLDQSKGEARWSEEEVSVLVDREDGELVVKDNAA